MKTIIDTKTTGKITIDSNFLGNKLWEASEKQQNYNNHVVTILHNKKKCSFDFWGSIMNPEISNDEENIFAFYCFLSDGIGAKESFEGFCDNFGYNNDSRNAEKIYKACQKSLKKIERVFDCDLYELINEIQETYNC
jgi:hypothetical protein